MRLLHAALRVHVLPRHLPDFDAARFGPAINIEDMLATVMGFSYLVIDGLRILGTPLAGRRGRGPLLRVARLRADGRHPPGRLSRRAREYVPGNVGEAAEFYAAYTRRHYVDAAQNPKGVVLAHDNLQMLQDLIPRVVAPRRPRRRCRASTCRT